MRENTLFVKFMVSLLTAPIIPLGFFLAEIFKNDGAVNIIQTLAQCLPVRYVPVGGITTSSPM